jgi:hypothetical protein
MYVYAQIYFHTYLHLPSSNGSSVFGTKPKLNIYFAPWERCYFTFYVEISGTEVTYEYSRSFIGAQKFKPLNYVNDASVYGFRVVDM